MAAGDIVQANLVQTLHAQTLLTRFFYVTDTGPGDLSAFLTAFGTRITAALPPILSSDWTGVRIDVQRVSPRPVTFQVTEVLNAPGQNVGPSLPSSVAVVVSKRTQFAGRKYRGRWYFGGFRASDTLNSQLTASALALIQTQMDTLATPLVAGANETWFPILSHGYIAGTEVIAYDKLTGVTARQILRNQRRRQIGVGI
jgi:hypothetical protein